MKSTLSLILLFAILSLLTGGAHATTIWGLWDRGSLDTEHRIVEFNAATQTGGTLIVPNIGENSPDVEYIGGAFVTTTASVTKKVEVWSETTGNLLSSVAMDFSSSTVSSNVVTALEYFGGTLYASGALTGSGNTTNAEFGTLSTTTGVFSPIGLTGIANPLGGLAYNGTTLYGITAGGSTGDLYTINPMTGVATFVGSTGQDDMSGLEFGSDGVLYAIRTGRSTLYSIDPSDGTLTDLGDITGFDTTGDFLAITSAVNVPEPSTACLFISALLGLSLFRNRQR